MTQEEKQLLFTDLSARLRYGVKAEARGWDEEKEEDVLVPVTVYSVNTDGHVYFADNDYDITYCSIDACRLYLRPMSSMTAEEENFYYSCLDEMDGYKQTFPVIYQDKALSLLDWLNSHHFDYRGLIEKGLAIDVTEENNPYK